MERQGCRWKDTDKDGNTQIVRKQAGQTKRQRQIGPSVCVEKGEAWLFVTLPHGDLLGQADGERGIESARTCLLFLFFFLLALSFSSKRENSYMSSPCIKRC